MPKTKKAFAFLGVSCDEKTKAKFIEMHKASGLTQPEFLQLLIEMASSQKEWRELVITRKNFLRALLKSYTRR